MTTNDDGFEIDCACDYDASPPPFLSPLSLSLSLPLSLSLSFPLSSSLLLFPLSTVQAASLFRCSSSFPVPCQEVRRSLTFRTD